MFRYRNGTGPPGIGPIKGALDAVAAIGNTRPSLPQVILPQPAGIETMADADPPATDEERVAALIVAADKLSLHDRKRRIPREFMTGLFARVVPEDLSRYRASEIAALAEAVWSFMAERKPGEPKVAFDSPP